VADGTYPTEPSFDDVHDPRLAGAAAVSEIV
jgi:hypothetical protein